MKAAVASSKLPHPSSATRTVPLATFIRPQISSPAAKQRPLEQSPRPAVLGPRGGLVAQRPRLWHLRAYPLLRLSCVFGSLVVCRAHGVAGRAKHCFLFGFMAGLGTGEGGDAAKGNVTSHFLEQTPPRFRCLQPGLYRAPDPSAKGKIQAGGQEWPRSSYSHF